MTRLEDEVRSNRRGIRRLNAYTRGASESPDESIETSRVTAEISVSATLYTRPLNNQLVVGHPNANHGIGSNVGDQRGSWTQQATQDAGEFVVDGRGIVAEGLTDVKHGIGDIAVGSGTSPPATSDSSLGSESGRTHAWHEDPTTDTTRAVAIFGTTSIGDVIEEVGAEAENGDLLTRLTTTLDPSLDQEVKIEIDCTVSGSGQSTAAVTGVGVIADAFASEYNAVGLDSIALGTDTTDPTSSDTSLGNQVVEKEAGHDSGDASVRTYTVIFRGEPNTQPHDIAELGVFDESDNLVWRATFAAVEKDSNVRLRPSSTLRIR